MAGLATSAKLDAKMPEAKATPLGSTTATARVKAVKEKH